MKYLIIAAAILTAAMFASSAFAEGKLSTWTTTGIAGTSATTSVVVTGRTIAMVKAGGDVEIDWPVTEACVNQPKSCGGDMIITYARIMIAIRNGTWKPMHAEKEKPRCIEVDPLADDAGLPSKVMCK